MRTTLLVAGAVSLAISAARAAEPLPQPVQPKARITLSKETSRITEPLSKSGYVDYVAALDQLASAGVTKENNAAAGTKTK